MVRRERRGSRLTARARAAVSREVCPDARARSVTSTYPAHVLAAVARSEQAERVMERVGELLAVSLLQLGDLGVAGRAELQERGVVERDFPLRAAQQGS